MQMSRPRPLISLNLEAPIRSNNSSDDHEIPRKTWLQYLPLAFLVFLMLLPHPSFLIILVNHYIRTLHKPVVFIVHLLITYAITFLAFSSLIVCVARDPGPVSSQKSDADAGSEDGEMGLTEALMSGVGDDDMSPSKWCRKCWAPRPDRAHHCSICDRCVLKMDHHCPWLGSKCVGHRTYPAFLHFIFSVTALATYIGTVSGFAFWFSINNPFSIDAVTPIHELFMTFAGVAISLVMGSFLVYHMYLVSTNQTTLESMSPFVLLRHLPPLPASLRLSEPPLEHELSYNQRKLVKSAHKSVRLYDVGWKQNWAQVFGWKKPWGWVHRVFNGGGGKGDGRTFLRNPKADDMLSRLAMELAKVDKDI
ncbi:hypothetical protein SERLA73DRAFT_183607 [Serpula lacrymans var. lacrymans S7.3]|uniref:Palmitoyltransferase n=2 Tax=Serpula lacrymans var. lacrymans TaxID=341189 RepID=F8Q074_SERL3|nr:uncharacterized protein SERLADRAFT_416312 [Serpula lacrymans var. lacrymans S7.9]EGN98546.1 hypothetical protein SERLA73DRAFT_183607 [Serpula lacrymans var. lacrymans S7.3]EGO24115.1 hypothetical protein SERLADRAFT_416312 [Serpula lacrymans var. lacrymans S7.9]